LNRTFAFSTDARLPLNEAEFARDSGIGDSSVLKDAQAISGLWRPISYSVDGENRTLQLNYRILFKDNVFYMIPVNIVSSPKAWFFKIDTSSMPKRIDLFMDVGGKQITLYGIYQVSDTELKLCWAKETHPREFNVGAQNVTLIEFRRLSQ
jgi:uncharacterized protein (TIGR03067 family)